VTVNAEDVASLAEHLRHAFEAAVRVRPEMPATIDARFLRRLAGAVSAYEAAHGILSPVDPPPGSPGPHTPSLRRQTCPGCGEAEFEAVSDGWAVRIVCRRCRSCWRPLRRSLALTAPDSCPSCDLSDRCVNRSTAD
jgi:hypothetical protein